MTKNGPVNGEGRQIPVENNCVLQVQNATEGAANSTTNTNVKPNANDVPVSRIYICRNIESPLTCFSALMVHIPSVPSS